MIFVFVMLPSCFFPPDETVNSLPYTILVRFIMLSSLPRYERCYQDTLTVVWTGSFLEGFIGEAQRSQP